MQLEVRRVTWPIAATGAARGRTERSAVIVALRAASGAIGLGEAAPLPGMSAETLDDVARALAGISPGELAEAASQLAAGADAMSGPGRLPAAARFALETALLDVVAQERHGSIAALLQPRETWRSVPLAAVVDDVAGARAAWARGIRCLKIKARADELARVAAIADALPEATLRVDANRSWPRERVAALRAGLSPRVAYVEEPCAPPIAAPGIALDESLAGMTDDEVAAALAAGVDLVLKPTLLGLGRAMRLAALARAQGSRAIVTHGLEGPIGTAACAELALALDGDQAVGLAPHPALVAWDVAVPQLAVDRVQPADHAGLGFSPAARARLWEVARG